MGNSGDQGGGPGRGGPPRERGRCAFSSASVVRNSSFSFTRRPCMRHTLVLLRSAGLVGLPNVGKSTLFNALVRASLSQASNYPFTTISPTTAEAVINDPQLAAVGKLAGSAKVVPWGVSIKDIAGLIEGASKGAGLGNAFLADVREAAAIIQVVRCFEDGDVIHVNSTPDPTRDIGVIETELILADLQSIEKRLPGLKKRGGGDREAELQASWCAALIPILEGGLPARALEHKVDPRDLPFWHRLHLLTQKPTLYVGNVGEADMKAGGRNGMTLEVEAAMDERRRGQEAAFPGSTTTAKGGVGAGTVFVGVCAKVEAELALLEDEEERSAYLQEYGLQRSGLDTLLTATADILGLHAYYTCGPMETRAWAIPKGATLPRAAGAIHSDMEKGFISGDVIGAKEFLELGGEKGAKEAGKVRAEGKEYVVNSGDICVFKFKPPK